MQRFYAHRRIVIFFLGAGACVWAGSMVGVYFDLTTRQTVFPIALFVGIYVFILMHHVGMFGVVRGSERVSVVIGDLPSPVRERFSHEKVTLSSHEAREWLDDLLVRQQRGTVWSKR